MPPVKLSGRTSYKLLFRAPPSCSMLRDPLHVALTLSLSGSTVCSRVDAMSVRNCPTNLMKGVPMKMSHGWKANSKKKKAKPTYKIRWEALGLSEPGRTQASIDDIRSEVSVMATQGLSERAQATSGERRSRRKP